jgi:hypothetical protein
MPASTLPTTALANGHAARRPSTPLAFAVRLRDHAAELAGFLDGAELPAQLELKIAANLAASEGLLARATQAIEAADAAARELPPRPVALPA